MFKLALNKILSSYIHRRKESIMCPVAAESKNSKPSSKKINTNLGTVVEEDIKKNSQSLGTSSELN